MLSSKSFQVDQHAAHATNQGPKLSSLIYLELRTFVPCAGEAIDRRNVQLQASTAILSSNRASSDPMPTAVFADSHMTSTTLKNILPVSIATHLTAEAAPT